MPKNRRCARPKARASMTPQSYNSYNYSYVFGQDPYKRKHHIIFSQKEVKHITVAALLVIGIGFSIGLYGNLFGGFFPAWTWDVMAVFAVVMTSSFLIHEIAHKVIAQKKGIWAEFRLTTWGAVLTFASSIFAFQNDCSRCNDDWRLNTQWRRHRKDFACWTNNQHHFLKCSFGVSVHFTA